MKREPSTTARVGTLLLGLSVLTVWAGCDRPADQGMHTAKPRKNWRIHIRFKETQQIPEIGATRDLWFTSVMNVLFTRTDCWRHVATESGEVTCFDTSGEKTRKVDIPWKDIRRIEWQDSRLTLVLKENGFRLVMFDCEPAAEPRWMAVRYEKRIAVAGGYEIESSMDKQKFDFRQIELVEFR
jgi:hypothetical protein